MQSWLVSSRRYAEEKVSSAGSEVISRMTWKNRCLKTVERPFYVIIQSSVFGYK